MYIYSLRSYQVFKFDILYVTRVGWYTSIVKVLRSQLCCNSGGQRAILYANSKVNVDKYSPSSS